MSAIITITMPVSALDQCVYQTRVAMVEYVTSSVINLPRSVRSMPIASSILTYIPVPTHTELLAHSTDFYI